MTISKGRVAVLLSIDYMGVSYCKCKLHGNRVNVKRRRQSTRAVAFCTYTGSYLLLCDAKRTLYWIANSVCLLLLTRIPQPV